MPGNAVAAGRAHPAGGRQVFNTTLDARRPAAAREPPRPPPTAGWSGRPGAGSTARLLTTLAQREGPRRVLWLPVALAAGIAAYFSCAREPPVFLGPAMATAGVVVALWVRGSAVGVWMLLLLVAGSVGFTAAGLRTRTLATVMLQHEIWSEIEGRLTAIERRPSGQRLTLRELKAADPGGPLPTGVRITVGGRSTEAAALRIGDRIRVRVRLRPAPAPVAPGAFDFQRDAYFRGIGAVGFAVGPLTVVARAGAGPADGLWIAVDRLRDAVAGRIRAALPGSVGGIAAAMLVGDRAGIDGETDEVFRETGLAHLLSISGLHMGMVAGAVFGAVRTVLAAWPAVALRRPIKKWAAAVALVATAFYLLLSGAPVPAQRAFMMTGLVLFAVLLDRDALSLHLVAWAAAAVLLVSPESLTGPSFQLSFAAVIALIAAWEAATRRRRSRLERGTGPLLRGLRYVGGVVATSVVASVATAPIIAHHFQQIPALGAVANVVAVPLTAFVTMPAGAVALLVMPAELERWPLAAMGWGIEAMLWAAGRVADGPLTAVGVTALGTGALAWVAIGGLWLALWRTPIRWLGLALVLTGFVLAGLERSPDALFSDDGELAAVRVPGQGWAVSSQRGSGFLRDSWQRRRGGAHAVSFAEADAGDGVVGFDCDGLGCVLRVGRRLLALPTSPEAAREDCRHADVVVARIRLRGQCLGARLVVDREALRRGGAHAVWLSGAEVRIRSVNDARGDRPWVVRQLPRAHPKPDDD